ncbi:MAG: HTTM domain-containing protein [Pirellulaceae bacterium]|nr:HTTM domain-containing protein [Pirellulaceae bacterium]
MRHRSSGGKPDSATRSTSIQAFVSAWVAGWDRFWFTPRTAEALGFMRIACGAMLTYIHVIWTSLLSDFMGRDAWINNQAVRSLHSQDWAWSWLYFVVSPVWLYAHQTIAIVASLCMALGCMTRLAIPVAWWMTLMVCHRMTGALFGLDQIVMMLTMYLMWSDCGTAYSLDARRANRGEASWLRPAYSATVSNNVVTRLIQIHVCVVYLFGGLSKLRGEMWWDGSAMWFSLVNYEYQSLDLTWLGHFPIIIGLLTAITVFWETFYCALIWPKLTRPMVLALAVCVHGGICVALGMWTFGTMMLVANCAFVEPTLIQRLMSRLPWLSKSN